MLGRLYDCNWRAIEEVGGIAIETGNGGCSVTNAANNKMFT